MNTDPCCFYSLMGDSLVYITWYKIQQQMYKHNIAERVKTLNLSKQQRLAA